MDITFKSKTYAECADFLKLLFEGKEYTLDEFSAAFKKSNFDLEQLLPQCEIIYSLLGSSGLAEHYDTKVFSHKTLRGLLEELERLV